MYLLLAVGYTACVVRVPFKVDRDDSYTCISPSDSLHSFSFAGLMTCSSIDVSWRISLIVDCITYYRDLTRDFGNLALG